MSYGAALSRVASRQGSGGPTQRGLKRKTQEMQLLGIPGRRLGVLDEVDKGVRS